MTDFPRLISNRVVQSVGANVAPETIEAVAIGRRSRAHEVEDARGDVESNLRAIDLGGVNRCGRRRPLLLAERCAALDRSLDVAALEGAILRELLRTEAE
jgi:hypothetical protein